MRPTNELAQTIPSQNPTVDAMASVGRKGDTMMAHVTPGDYVIPKDILVQHPEFLVKLKKAMEDEGQDYRNHMVGSGFENINPETGAPEFGFGKAFKKMSSAVGGVVQGLTGSRQAGGIGAAIGGGFFTPLALAAPASYNQYMRETAKKSPSFGQASSTYTPSEMKLPSSLQELGGLTDTQKRSYLASQGAQGEGLGGSSRDYYINLLQRNIQSNPNQELLPVETQYLRQGNIDTNLRGQALVDALRGF